MKSRLAFKEWFVVLVLCGLLLTLGGVAFFSKSASVLQMSSAHVIKTPEMVEVHVEGAVEHPGIYTLPKGETLGSLLAQVEPLLDADLSSLKPESKLRADRTISIPRIKMITIFLEGAVKHPGPLEIREGARLQDLITLNICLDGANVKVLNKKRKLKDLEVIHIPCKRNTIVKN